MKTLFRPAVPNDLAVLWALDTAMDSDLGRARQIQAWITTNCAHVAVQDQSIAGYGAISHDFFHSGMVEMLMIAEPFRRRGIGAGLLSHMETFCQTSTLWSSTNLSNIAMQKLLDRAGFIRSGRVEGLDENDPELIYRKRLR